jgi:phosphoribosylaminoimidazole carboxylase PurK protein
MIQTIGIIGGGQLGRMLTEAASNLDLNVVVVDPNPNCPAAQVGARQILAGFNDTAAIAHLAKQSDVLTVESEHINVGALELLSKHGKKVYPTPNSIKITQDKLLEKLFLQSINVPVPDFAEITSENQAESVLQKFSGQMVIKKRIGGYDGKGNFTVRSKTDIKKAFNVLGAKGLYAEKFISFKKELAIMVARSLEGKTAVYPLTETIQKNHICNHVIVPAQIGRLVREQAEAIGKKIVKNLNSPGVFGVEMFLDFKGQVLGNEIAPRVHNSGHYTIEASKTSQFEQHLRAITGLPLGSTKLRTKAAVMVNILGEREGMAKIKGLIEAEALGDAFIHIYGKAETKVGRKMGHITVLADTIEKAKQKCGKARKLISV